MRGPVWGDYYWPAFLFAVAVMFAVPEIYALCTNTINSLTDYVHLQLNVNTATVARGIHTLAWYASLAGWILFVIIITWHIWWIS
jgi:hypothetical protein